MPRKARIDAPGALHHIIVRGIERRRIFLDDQDRDNFIERLGDIVTETNTFCFAWALIHNHVHILLRTGQTSLATVMRRLLTGYAVSYNRRHRRGGMGMCFKIATNPFCVKKTCTCLNWFAIFI
jgi:REP element-mobilizing transposase RayT